MDYGIAGKRALVLGGSRGLGAASARALAGEGAKVWVAARSAEAGTAGAGITPLPLDLGDPASIEALIARLTAAGDVDILVNNSGGPPPGKARGQSGDSWSASFATMARSLFAITDAVLPGMIARGWGRIITIGSSSVVQPIPGLALSNGVRGAVAGWSKTLAAEVAATGVTVNMVLPGRIDTDRVRQIDAGQAKSTGASIETVQNASFADIPAGRYGRPEEFAAAVAFLASTQASYITGSMLRVDGGLIRGL